MFAGHKSFCHPEAPERPWVLWGCRAPQPARKATLAANCVPLGLIVTDRHLWFHGEFASLCSFPRGRTPHCFTQDVAGVWRLTTPCLSLCILCEQTLDSGWNPVFLSFLSELSPANPYLLPKTMTSCNHKLQHFLHCHFGPLVCHHGGLGNSHVRHKESWQVGPKSLAFKWSHSQPIIAENSTL